MRTNDTPNSVTLATTTSLPPIDWKTSERRYDVDWLRVLAMGTIFLFHCARFFDYDDWHIKNLVLSHGLSIFVMFTAQWIMPLFFILSGIGALYGLSRRTNAGYIRERFLRLVVPLIFGIFILSPPQVYIERISHNQFEGGLFSFLPHYFDGMYGFGGNFAWMGLHLWYLELLFVFSLLTLPLFRAAIGGKLRNLLNATASPCAKPGGILLFAVPLFLMELLVNAFPDTLGIRSFGGWSPLTYLVFFVIGYVVGSDDRFGQAFERRRVTWLIMGVAVSAFGLALIETGILNGLPRAATLPIEAMLRALNSWFWLMAIIGFGRRYLNFSSRALAYMNRAVLPFYILHQTVIVIVAFSLVGWAAPVPVTYTVLAASSFAVIMALYEGIVRRIGALRFLFGMKKP